MAARQDGAGQIIVFGREEGIKGHNRGQPAVDGGGLETLRRLLADEVVYIVKGDLAGWALPNDLDEEMQVIALIIPRIFVLC